MQKYELKTPVRGLPRADGLRAPVDVGAVVALPWTRAAELLTMDAIAESDADVTCPLNWVSEESGQENFPPIPVVAATDRHALVGALEDLGGVAFFVGDGLPDRAEQVLCDFSNEQLLAEIRARIEEDRLQPVLLSDFVAGAADGDASGAPSEASTDPALPAAATETPRANEPAEAKPSRKKVAAK